MPHIRKPNETRSPLSDRGNVRVIDCSKVEKTISKVDQPNKHGIIKFDGLTDGGIGNGNESNNGSVSVDGQDAEEDSLKQAYAGKRGIGEKGGKSSDGTVKKIDGCAKSKSNSKAVKETGNGRTTRNSVENYKNSENTILFVTSVDHFSGKDKKVKFVEGPGSSSRGSDNFRKSSHPYKSDKYRYYPSYKPDTKSLLPLPQPPELFVPQLGEIAVVTDLVPDDPISACLPCLEANGTYICTPCNPRCFIIQKVRRNFFYLWENSTAEDRAVNLN
ncbi:hypothetical protein RUM43_003193 [Polyplax serrata]|uniref:Uncharacterized protein n=1 Tax=Polyplax serrata TaxID=468196 RepID=A0AAN8S9C5_POLSC